MVVIQLHRADRLFEKRGVLKMRTYRIGGSNVNSMVAKALVQPQ